MQPPSATQTTDSASKQSSITGGFSVMFSSKVIAIAVACIALAAITVTVATVTGDIEVLSAARSAVEVHAQYGANPLPANFTGVDDLMSRIQARPSPVA